MTEADEHCRRPDAPVVRPRPGHRLRSSDACGLQAAKLGDPQIPGRHVTPVGAQAGARELAANVYELDPGAVGSPLHVHHANEELLLVFAGTPSLRGPDGTQLLPAGAVVAFPRGQAGAHSLVNRSDVPVRYLVVSTTNRPDVVDYPTQARRSSSSPSSAWLIRTAPTRTKSPSSPKRCGWRPTETPDLAENAATALAIASFGSSTGYRRACARSQDSSLEAAGWRIRAWISGAVRGRFRSPSRTHAATE